MTGRPLFTPMLALLAALGFSTLLASAQENQPSGPLTVDEAVQIALKQNHDVAIAAGSAAAARGRALSSYSGVLPQVNASAAYNHESISGPRFSDDLTGGTTVSDAQSFNAGLDQSIFSWSRIQDIKGANANSRAFAELLDNQRLDVALTTRIQYYELYKAIQLLQVRDEGVQLSEDQLRRAETLFELGSVARNDVIQARVNLQQARLDQITARNAAEVQRARLNQILGIPLNAPIEISAEIPAPDTTAIGNIDSVAVYREALAERPDLQAARETVSEAQSQLGSAKGGYFPELFGQLNYFSNLRQGIRHVVVRDQDGNPIGELIRGNDSEGWNAAAGVRLNVFDGLLREGEVNSAKGNLAVERARLLQSELAVQVEVKEAILGVREATQSITAATEGVALAEENLKLAQERYQVGSGTLLELDEAQVSLIESRSALVDAEAALRVAEARLDRARGGGLPPGTAP